MSTIHAIILAIIEGLTEFLPISSTAHLRFANPLIGANESAFRDVFEVVIQLAAILSVVVLYWKKFFDFKRIQFYIKLIIALVPAVIFGVLFKKHIDAALDNPAFIAFVMIGGGIVLLFIDGFFKRPAVFNEAQVNYKKSFIIGCFQVLSILFPGLSRSAATIIGGLSQRLDRNTAATFSFFLAVPTMLAASVKALYDVHKTHPEALAQGNIITLLIGSLIAFLVAMLAIRVFIGYLQKHGFRLFGYYRIALGLIVLLLIYRGTIH